MIEDTLTYDCQYNKYDEGVNYTCNGVDIQNSEGVEDTNFEIALCNDENLSDSETKCSIAKVPVLFVD